MNTRTFTMHPILGCFSKAEDFLGKEREWKSDEGSVNAGTQKEFLEGILAAISDVEKIDEMKSIADVSADVINKFLADEGFNIRLSQIPPGQGFAVASVMKILVEWVEKGTCVDIRAIDKKKYDGVQIKEKNVQYFRSQFHSEPIASPSIKSKRDSVFITKVDDALAKVIENGEFSIFEWIKKVRRGLLSEFNSYSYLEFPCIDYDSEVDISWLVGLNTVSSKDSKCKGDSMYVSEAKQQTKFRMNELGAKVESAAAMGMLRCCISSSGPIKKPLIIDGPFLLWMERSGVTIPYFVGVFNHDVWKKPEKLD